MRKWPIIIITLFSTLTVGSKLIAMDAELERELKILALTMPQEFKDEHGGKIVNLFTRLCAEEKAILEEAGFSILPNCFNYGINGKWKLPDNGKYYDDNSSENNTQFHLNTLFIDFINMDRSGYYMDLSIDINDKHGFNEYCLHPGDMGISFDDSDFQPFPADYWHGFIRYNRNEEELVRNRNGVQFRNGVELVRRLLTSKQVTIKSYYVSDGGKEESVSATFPIPDQAQALALLRELSLLHAESFQTEAKKRRPIEPKLEQELKILALTTCYILPNYNTDKCHRYTDKCYRYEVEIENFFAQFKEKLKENNILEKSGIVVGERKDDEYYCLWELPDNGTGNRHYRDNSRYYHSNTIYVDFEDMKLWVESRKEPILGGGYEEDETFLRPGDMGISFDGSDFQSFPASRDDYGAGCSIKYNGNWAELVHRILASKQVTIKSDYIEKSESHFSDDIKKSVSATFRVLNPNPGLALLRELELIDLTLPEY